MKNLAFCIPVFALLVGLLSSTVPAYASWNINQNWSGTDETFESVATIGTNIAAVGYTNAGGDYKIELNIYDENGCLTHQTEWGQNGIDYKAYSIDTDSSNNLIVSGTKDGVDGQVWKFTSSGSLVWTATEVGKPFRGVCTHGTDIFVVGGTSLFKYNSAGVQQYNTSAVTSSAVDCEYSAYGGMQLVYILSNDGVGLTYQVWSDSGQYMPLSVHYDHAPAVFHGLTVDGSYSSFVLGGNSSYIVSRRWNPDGHLPQCDLAWGTGACSQYGGAATDSSNNWHTVVYCSGEGNSRWIEWANTCGSAIDGTTYPFISHDIAIDSGDQVVMVGSNFAGNDGIIYSESSYPSCSIPTTTTIPTPLGSETVQTIGTVTGGIKGFLNAFGGGYMLLLFIAFVALFIVGIFAYIKKTAGGER